MKLLGISQTWLADHSFVRRRDRLVPVNRGTASRILNGEIPVSPDVLLAFGRNLGFEDHLLNRLFEAAVAARPSARQSAAQRQEPPLISDYYYPRAKLLDAVTEMYRGFYDGASLEISRIFEEAGESGDLIIQADAAGRIGLGHLETGELGKSDLWLRRSVASCSQYLRVPVTEIIRSAGRDSATDSASGTPSAARILSDTLHNHCQVLIRQMLYFGRDELERSARIATDSSLTLDRRLDLAQPIGNDLRCQAVLEVTGKTPNLKQALRLLSECKGNFLRGGLYEAHFIKTRGIVHLKAGRVPVGVRLLIDAQTRLAAFPDARGLALTKYLLGDAALLVWDDKHSPLRYLLAAAALHPYGFVIERCRREARYAERRFLQTEVDNLLAGNEHYRDVHEMMARLARGSEHTPQSLLRRNISLILRDGFPFVEIPLELRPSNPNVF